MGFLEQTPCFATDKHVSAMNSQRHHILRRPNLQDQRRLKFTDNLFRQNFIANEVTNVHKGHEGQIFIND
jgi:hypothetical protein